jgi:hypothetical protein
MPIDAITAGFGMVLPDIFSWFYFPIVGQLHPSLFTLALGNSKVIMAWWYEFFYTSPSGNKM